MAKRALTIPTDAVPIFRQLPEQHAEGIARIAQEEQFDRVMHFLQYGPNSSRDEGPCPAESLVVTMRMLAYLRISFMRDEAKRESLFEAIVNTVEQDHAKKKNTRSCGHAVQGVVLGIFQSPLGLHNTTDREDCFLLFSRLTPYLDYSVFYGQEDSFSKLLKQNLKSLQPNIGDRISMIRHLLSLDPSLISHEYPRGTVGWIVTSIFASTLERSVDPKQLIELVLSQSAS